MGMTAKRIVLDTNIWLDWLVFKDSSLLYLKKEFSEGRVEILIDAACEAELERVLAYDLAKHTLDAAAQAACLAECRRIVQRVDHAAPEAERKLLPRCADPDDQKFLELALAARADALVTKDHKLLELARRTKAFRILNPRKFSTQ
jgi:putative PIN family toxin of toxin-antitoxin system